jgi:hypothetical protein
MRRRPSTLSGGRSTRVFDRLDTRTVLIVAEVSDLKFDVRGQRCLVYHGSIKTLEEMLRKELVTLAQAGRATGGSR